MIQKRLLRPERVRQVPSSFNWVDHRLARDHYLERCDCTALALYLFLVVVSDAQGRSVFGDSGDGFVRREGSLFGLLRACAVRRWGNVR